MDFNLVGLIFRVSMIVSLLFAGIAKLVWIKNTISSIKKMQFFPKVIEKYIGILMPLLEIFLGMAFLFSNSIWIFGIYVGYLLFFIFMNLRFYADNIEIDCCCYGKLLPSKLGLGGLLYYVYELITGVMSFVMLKETVISNINNWNYIISFAFIVVIGGLIMRREYETVFQH